jgi:hypothetical protein
VTATPREGNLVTVKLDRDIVARLAALKVVRKKKSYSALLREILPAK